MYPCPRITSLHRVKGCFVKAMFARATLACKMQFGKFSTFTLLNCTLDRQRQLDHQTLHVRLDFVQVLFAKMLHSIPRLKRLKNRHSIRRLHPRRIIFRSGFLLQHFFHLLASSRTGQRAGQLIGSSSRHRTRSTTHFRHADSEFIANVRQRLG